MRLKDVQLLGILALIAAGIFLLSLLRGGGKGEPTSPPGGGTQASRQVGSPEQSYDEWLRLTGDRHPPPEERQAHKAADEGSLRLHGDQSIEPAGDSEQGIAGERSDSDLIRELEEMPPEEIPLREIEDQAPTPPVQEPTIIPKVHIVQRGDTLTALSRKYYNTAAKWKFILEANRTLITRPEDLRPGMQLVIPKLELSQLGAAPGAGGTPTLTGRALPPGTRYYDVQKGDTLWQIAEKTYGDGTAWTKIMAANSDLLKDPGELQPDMRLILP